MFDAKYGKRLQLWTNREEFKKMQTEWYFENFLKQNAEEIVKIVTKYDTQNMQMKIKGRDEVDEVLDAFTMEVKAVVAHAPLITALGNPAMKPRHWKKVFALTDGNFTGSLDLGITFNQLIQDGADNYVE